MQLNTTVVNYRQMWYKLCVQVKITRCGRKNKWESCGGEVTQANSGLKRPLEGQYSSPVARKPIVGMYFTALYRALASSRTRLLDHIQRRASR